MGNEVRIRVTADDDATKKLDGISAKIKASMGGIANIAVGGLLTHGIESAGAKLQAFAGESIAAAKESRMANAQLDAVLKSTAGAAGMTANELRDMASKLEKVSLFEDEAIIGGQSLLLTFTNIGKDVFPEATQAILDMSQALGQDMKSSAIQLGKALQDPEDGITALRRVGVAFTDEQKDLIKTMIEAGDVTSAQRLILAELNKEFGGSAKAASDAAGAAERQKDRMNELNEVIGEKLLPIQEKWKEAQIVAIDYMITKVIPTLEALYAKHWPAISKAIEKITPIIVFMVEHTIERLSGMVQAISAVAEIVGRVVNGVKALINGDWRTAWDEFKGIPEAMINLMIGSFRSLLGKFPELLYNAGRDVIQGLWDGMKAKWEEVKDWFSSIPNAIPKALKSVLKIGSPSKVMQEIGVNTMQGFLAGLQSKQGEIQSFLGGLNSSVTPLALAAPKQGLRAATGAVEGSTNTGALASAAPRDFAITVNGGVVVNNGGQGQDVNRALASLGYAIRAQARSRGVAVLA